MRRGSGFAKLLAIGLLATGAGCNLAHKSAVRRAQQAEARGDRYEAAEAYQRACRKKLSDRRSCNRAELLAREAIDADVAAARALCREGDFDACLEALAPAQQAFPDDPVLLAFLEESARMQAASCLEISLQEPVRAVARLRCLEGSYQRADSDSLGRLALDEARRTGETLQLWAEGMDAERRPGATYALWALAACAAPGASRAHQLDLARERYVERYAVPVELEIEVDKRPDPDLAQRVCQHLAGHQRGAIRCGQEGAAVPPLRVAARASLRKPRHRKSVQQRSLRFQSGSKQIDNPNYPRARDDLYLAERALREIERDLVDREASCEAARQALARTHDCADCPARRDAEQACAAHRALRDSRDRRAQALESAQRRLNLTPASTTTPVFAEHRYPVTHHRWTAAYTIELRVPGEKRPAVTDRGELTRSDEEHSGLADADLEADPLDSPEQGFFDDDLVRRLLERIDRYVSDDLERRAAEQRATCNRLDRAGPTEVECRAAGALWNGRGPGAGDAPIPSRFGLETGRRFGQPLRCLATPGGAGAPAWIGVLASVVTPALAVDAGLERPRGAVVDRVVTGSPAAAAGIAAGDIIVRLHGVQVEEPADLGRVARRVGPGSRIAVKLLRVGELVELTLPLAQPPTRDD